MFRSIMKTVPMFCLSLCPFSLALPQAPSSSAPLPQATTVHRFPNGTFVENLAIRSNGGIIANILTSPEVAYVDPINPAAEAKIIARFPSPATSVLGIAEAEPDVFYVATGNFSLQLSGPPVNGTGQIWRIDMSKYEECEGENVPVDLVANITDSGLINGITLVPGTKTLLLADSIKGLIWRLNVDTKENSVFINDTSTARNFSAAFTLGPNGVHAQDGYAYWTSTSHPLLYRAPIDAQGVATGPSEVRVPAAGVAAPDDFALAGPEGSAYITDAVLNAVQFTDGTEKITPIVNVTSPTSVQLGRLENGRTIYITNTGNTSEYSQNPVPTGGSILKYDLP